MKRNSFTLIELIIGLTIFSIISVVIYSSFQAGIFSWKKIDSRLNEEQAILVLFNSFEKEIHNCINFKEGLTGDKNNLTFYSIKGLKTDNQQLKHILNISYFSEKNKLERKELVLGKGQEPVIVPLIAIKNLNFNYFNKNNWYDNWYQKALLPEAIQIEITTKQKNYKKLVAIPLGAFRL